MAPIHILFLVFPLLNINIVQSSWVETKVTPPPTQTLTKLHFYFHEVERGPEKTVAIVAKPENSSVFDFGTLRVIDEPLTVGIDRSSKLIGRAQGMYAIASKTRHNLLMTMTLSFMEKGYNGSSIVIMGRYNVDDEVRELPIIGGAGVFKFARGYVVAKKTKLTKDEITVEYNVFVMHSDI